MSDTATHRQRTRRSHRKRSLNLLRPGIFLAAAAIVAVVAWAMQDRASPELILRAGPATSGATLGSSPSSAKGSVTSGSVTSGSTGSGSSSSAASSSAARTPAERLTPMDPSGVAMPVGDTAGWHQAFRDDFTTPVPEGSFPGSAYATSWKGYEDLADAAGTGTYATSRISSVHDGELDLHLHSVGGRALVAAAVPLVGGTGTGQRYGRYVVRYRADTVPGYSVAWVLWPDSNDFSDGEVDYPEGDAGGPIDGTMRCPGAPTTTCLAAGSGATSATWHTATVQWSPTGTTFSLDGAQVGHSATTSTAPLHWVLQVQTGRTAPAASAAGHVLVDWVSVYTRS